jgi:hypothetical protein
MAPMHDMSAAAPIAEPRRANRLPTRHPAFEVRTRVRVTFAESPELYLREEMV